MNLRKTRSLCYALGALILVLALLGGILQDKRFLYPVVGVFALFAVICFTQWRCPRCGSFMRQLTAKKCPRCGHKLDL